VRSTRVLVTVLTDRFNCAVFTGRVAFSDFRHLKPLTYRSSWRRGLKTPRPTICAKRDAHGRNLGVSSQRVSGGTRMSRIV
jgi:hypothetical protein